MLPAKAKASAKIWAWMLLYRVLPSLHNQNGCRTLLHCCIKVVEVLRDIQNLPMTIRVLMVLSISCIALQQMLRRAVYSRGYPLADRNDREKGRCTSAALATDHSQ